MSTLIHKTQALQPEINSPTSGVNPPRARRASGKASRFFKQGMLKLFTNPFAGGADSRRSRVDASFVAPAPRPSSKVTSGYSSYLNRFALLAAAVLFVTVSANATLLLTDDMTGYTTAANLDGQGSWTFSGSGPHSTVQNTTPLTYSGYNGGGGNYVVMGTPSGTTSRTYKGFTSTTAIGNTFYASFLIRLTATTATGDYFITLGDPTTGTTYGPRLFAKTSGAGFVLGVGKNVNVASAVFGTTVLSLNTTYLVVMRFTGVTGNANDLAYVWVNPSLASEPTTGSAECSDTTGADAVYSGGNIGNFLWHNRTANNPSGAFDGVRVAAASTSAAAWSDLAASVATFPSAPTITGITPANAQLSVAFTAGSDGGSAILNYKYSTDGGSTFTAVSPASTASPIVISGLVNGTSYNVQIKAVNAVGDGTATASTTATPSAPPSAPIITSITPGNTILSVAFTAGANGGAAISNYKYSTDGGSTFTAVSPASTASPIVISGLVNGTSYNVQIKAVNAAGDGTATASTAATPVTTPSAPTITSITPGNTTLSVAFTAGANGGSAITDYKYSTDGGSTFTSAGQTTSPINILGLANGTTYNVQLKAVNAAGDGAATASTPATPSAGAVAPTVTSSAATSIGTTAATLNGNVTADGGASVTDRGFVYKTSSGAGIGDNKTVAAEGASGTGTISLTPTLSVNVQYFFKAYAINSAGTTLSSPELSFWTLANTPTAPTVDTPAQTSLNVTIGLGDGNPSTTAYAIQETTSGNYVQASGALGGTAVYQTATTWGSKTVTGLTGNTTYTFKVKAQNGAGTDTAFSSTTSGTTSPLAPKVTSSAATSIGTTAATLNGNVTDDGGATVTDRGFVYKANSGGATINDNKTVAAEGASGTGTISLTPTLSVNVQYFYKAYAINSAGTTLSSPELSFWTLANTPSTPTVGGATTSSLNVTIGSGDGNPSTTTYAIQETGGSQYVQASGALGATAVYLTATAWGTKTVTGLTGYTTYTFKVKARNGVLTDTAFSSTASGTTLVAPTLVAGWDFQTTTGGGTAAVVNPNSPTTYVANFGTGTIYLDGEFNSDIWSAATELSAFAGTAVNAATGFSTTTTSPACLALLGGGTGTSQTANGKHIVFKFSMANKGNLVVSYATQGTATGFNSQLWEYSTDGTTWTSAGTVSSISTSFATKTLTTITGLNGASTAYLRLTGSGATSASGNNRLDNIQMTALNLPTISGVAPSQSISYGTASVTLSGTVSAPGPIYPADGETVNVTINGSTQPATISGGAGGFSVNFPTATIPLSATPYTITYAYAGDANLTAAANNTSTTLRVGITVPNLTYTIATNVSLAITLADIQAAGLASAQGSPTYSITGVNSPTAAAGTVIFNASNIKYTNSVPITVADSFSYTVTDGTASGSGLVTVNFTYVTGPQITPSGTDGNGHPVLSFRGLPGYTYHFQRATTLTPTPDWATQQPGVTVPSNGDGSATWTDINDPIPNPAYYRLSYP